MSNYDKYSILIEKLKKSQFNISALYVDVDVEIALKRALNRASSTGRAVPEEIVRKTNLMSAKTFYKLHTRFDEAILFNNSKEFNSSLAPFAVKELSKLKPYNLQEYQLFMKKVDS